MNDTPETDEAVKASNGQWSFVLKETCQRLERERDEAREERDHWKTEYEIVVARLCGKKHPSDNGIFSEHEIIPKLTQERDEARESAAKWEAVALREASINGARICAKEDAK